MKPEVALAIIDHALSLIPMLRQEVAFSSDHAAFVQSTGLELVRIFGANSPIWQNFQAIDYQSIGSFVSGPFINEEVARRRADAYQRGLGTAEGFLRSARQQLESQGVDLILTGNRIRTEGPRVFVSHGKETAALTKVERYLRAVGTQPIVVVRGPSEGLAIDDLVEKRMTESDCVLVLATSDEDVDGRRQPRPNVLHEIGMAQEKLGNKIIYLKEVGCEFPSNVGPKVWENFTQENMEAAFEKIMKELRAFGLV